MLHQLSVHVPDPHSSLDVLLLQELLTTLHHLVRVGFRQPSCLCKTLHQADSQVELRHLVCSAASLHQELVRLSQSPDRLFVIAVLVDLDLGAGIVEGRQLVVRLCLGIESDNLLHNLRVVVPVQALHIICSKDVDLWLARRASKEGNFLRVATLQQALHCLHLVPSLGEFLARELEGPLLLAQLRHAQQQVGAGRGVHRGLVRSHALGHVVRHLHVVLTAQVHSTLELLRDREQVHGLVVLLVLHEEFRAASQHLGVAVSIEVVRDLAKRIEQLGLEAKLQSARDIARLLVQSDSPGELLILLVIPCGLIHVGRGGGQSETHQVVLHVVLLRQAKSVLHSSSGSKIVDSFLDLALLLEVPSQVVARGLVSALVTDLHGLLNVLVETSNAN
mmetsp:Transcript_32732/g.84884  ORF Transcript_32732/g.84884 Transcript_32732/m.84884 type:complete len:391 (+) Transcript_32732:267-1439(+)